MNRGKTENCDSPLDEVLENLPEEKPPTDLKERCLSVLGEGTRGRLRGLPWGAVLRNVAAVAAAFMLVAGVASFWGMGRQSALNGDYALRGPGRPLAYEEPALKPVADEPPSLVAMPEETVTGARLASRSQLPPPEGAPTAEAVDAGAMAEPEPSSQAHTLGLEARTHDGIVWGGPDAGVGGTTNQPRLFTSTESAEAPSAASSAYGGPDRRGVGGVYQRYAQPPEGPAGMSELDSAAGDRVATVLDGTASDAHAKGISTARPATAGTRARQAADVKAPWRDESHERKIATQKEMEMEVRRVEDAYDDARAIITKHGGYVANDSLRIGIGGDNRVDVVARIPSYEFEDALAEIRRLGKVVRLVGTSRDMTYDYYTEGSKIREMADKEAALIEKLDREKDARKKAQIKHELNALRRQLHSKKTFLGQLSEEVHWPVLQLTLTDKAGPGQFLTQTLDNLASIGAWAAATAIFWVPLVVILALVWRRRRPA